jgi:outer membrane protein assembly factor BamA
MPRLTWDNLDNPLNPTRGFFATGYVGYIQAVDATSDGQLRNFLKYESTLKAFLTIRSTVTIAMLARAGGGLPLGRDDTQLPANERFRIGGTHGLRGYIDDGIRQYDKRGRIVTLDTDGDGVDDEVASDGDVVVNGSLELRFPLARGAGLWGATFWDWGGIAEDWSDMHAASVRHGLGLGLRWLVANQIPVRVDYGFAVSQRCQSLILDDTGQPTDGCNIEPAGQFHAGLLYAF